MKPLRKAIFPVAGMGTRFLPATKSVPKDMLTVVDRPVIDYAVREAVEAGCDTLIFITGRSKQAIANYFDRSPELEKELEEYKKRNLELEKNLDSLRLSTEGKFRKKADEFFICFFVCLIIDKKKIAVFMSIYAVKITLLQD